jgi:AraC family transcriptional regulator
LQVQDQLSNATTCHLSTTILHQMAIERVILAMRERLHEPLTLEDMADIAHLSPCHFSRVFHRLIGVPPSEFLAALRLDAAKRLLLTTSMSVTDVCFEVGYTSLGSFTTRFTQLVGMPPRKLRQVADDFAMPALESLPDPGTYTFCHVPYRGCLFGQVIVPGPFRGLIFVGLFPKPIPQGRPSGCTLLSAPGWYFIKALPDGCYYVLAAAIPLPAEPRAYHLPGTGLLVGMSQGPLFIANGKMNGCPDVALHSPRLTDPPIVAALPFI